jgi:hypothetical protein
VSVRFRVWPAVLVLAVACEKPPIEWSDPVAAPSDSASSIVLQGDGRIAPASRLSIQAPSAPGQCAQSVRVARDSLGDVYAVWWQLRSDSTADLVLAHSSDGRTWDTPIRVDTLDAGRVGCRRVAPSIDAHGGSVHVAYSMAAREGPGIFASHSMDQGAMFHSPVAVVYGERIGGAAIAAKGDVVVVAYEDPNTEPRRISVALSRTMAHLFQSRMSVSPPGARARAPDVTLGNRRVAVTWLEGTEGDSLRMIRVGVIR